MTTGYAIQALTIIARSSTPYVLVRDIAQATGIPAPYLSKVSQRLVDAGVLDSKRGYQGGVRLVRKPEEISLLEIDEAVDMGARKPQCLLGNIECSDERSCPVHSFWKVKREEIRTCLSGLSLAALADFDNARSILNLPGPAPKKRRKKAELYPNLVKAALAAKAAEAAKKAEIKAAKKAKKLALAAAKKAAKAEKPVKKAKVAKKVVVQSAKNGKAAKKVAKNTRTVGKRGQ